MAKAKRKRPKGWWVQERIAKQQSAKDRQRAQWLAQKVYGRKNEPAPPDGPSTSVRALPSGFETSRRH